MGYYYAGNRNSRSDKNSMVESTEVQGGNVQEEKYPGSVVMMERGWNPYKDEEEPQKYLDEAENRRSRQHEGNAGDERNWQREENAGDERNWQREGNAGEGMNWQREGNAGDGRNWQREGNAGDGMNWQHEGNAGDGRNWQREGNAGDGRNGWDDQNMNMSRGGQSREMYGNSRGGQSREMYGNSRGGRSGEMYGNSRGGQSGEMYGNSRSGQSGEMYGNSRDGRSGEMYGNSRDGQVGNMTGNGWDYRADNVTREGGRSGMQSENAYGTCRKDCNGRSSLMMEMPELDHSEQESMKQWNQVSSGQNCWRVPGMRNGQPYQRYDYLNVLEDERMMENELRRLQSMYPQAARDILPLVEETCDKMEYEGSMMFDEHPDQNTVRRMSDDIYGQIKEMYPEEEKQQTEEVQSMEFQRGRRRPPHGNFLSDLVQVMLVQEMHRRRCRHHRCRPGRY